MGPRPLSLRPWAVNYIKKKEWNWDSLKNTLKLKKGDKTNGKTNQIRLFGFISKEVEKMERIHTAPTNWQLEVTDTWPKITRLKISQRKTLFCVGPKTIPERLL